MTTFKEINCRRIGGCLGEVCPHTCEACKYGVCPDLSHTPTHEEIRSEFHKWFAQQPDQLTVRNEDIADWWIAYLLSTLEEVKGECKEEKMIDGGDGLADTAQCFNAGLEKAQDILSSKIEQFNKNI